MINGAAYGLLGVGFALILGVTGRFHFAYSFTYALAAYMVFWWSERVGVGFWLAAVLGIATATIVGVGIERFVYRPRRPPGRGHRPAGHLRRLPRHRHRRPEPPQPAVLVGVAADLLGPEALRTPIHWGQASFRWLDVWQVLIGRRARRCSSPRCLRFTPLGRSIKATRGNPEMARIIGIDPNRIYLVVFAIGTVLCGVAAFWFGVKYSVQPDMGFKPVIFAFVVAFLAGTASSPIRVFVVGILIGLIEQWSTDLARGPLEPAGDLRRAPALPDLAVARAEAHRRPPPSRVGVRR